MRQRILILLLLAVTLIGCKKAEVEYRYVYVSNELRFDITSGDITRANIVTNSATMSNVGILAEATEKELWDPATDNDFSLIQNKRLYYDETTPGWEYTLEEDIVRWGNPEPTDRFTFFGYSPYMYTVDVEGVDGTMSPENILVPQYAGDPYPTLFYDCLPDYSVQRDILIAEPMIDIYRPSSNHVPLLFHHALTCIGVQVRECVKRDDKAVRQIKAVRITGVDTKGKTRMDGANIAWSIASGSDRNRVYNIGHKCDSEQEKYYTLETVSVHADYSTDFMLPNGYLMLMPQTIPDGAKIEMEFMDGDIYDYEISGSWSPNQRVVYNITIGVGEIVVDNTVVYDWEKTLIKAENNYSLDPNTESWDGSIYVPVDDFGVNGNGDNNSGASSDSYEWEGYISPGFIQSTTPGSSSSTGSGASGEPDDWSGYILSNALITGGTAASGSGNAGVSGDNADVWDGSFETSTDTVGGSTSTGSGSSGSSGDNADVWDGSFETSTDTVGGSTSTGSGTSGTSGETAENWEGSFETSTDTVGGSTATGSGSSGTSGETAENWEGSIENAAQTVGGSTSTGSGTSGTSGETAENWEGSIENAAQTVGGTAATGSGSTGSSGDISEDWQGTIEHATQTVGGTAATGSGTTGSSGDISEDWQGVIVSAQSTKTQGTVDIE